MHEYVSLNTSKTATDFFVIDLTENLQLLKLASDKSVLKQ